MQSDRTPYTYSESESYRTHSPHRRVGSPNMARRALRGPSLGNTSLENSMGSTVQATGLQQHHEDSAANWRASFTITDSEDEGEPLSSRLQGSLDTSDLLVQHRAGAGLASTTPATIRHGGANTRYSSSTTTVTRKVHYGLDYESDGDDLASNGGSSKKRLQHRATPLVATASNNNNNTSSLLGNHLPATSLLLGNNVGSTSQDYSTVNSYSSSGRHMYTDDGVGSDGREGGVLSNVASAVKSTVHSIANTPTAIRNSLSRIGLLASSKNGDTADYDSSSNSYQYTNNNNSGKLTSVNNNNYVNAKYSSVVGGGGLGDSVSRSRGGGSSSSVKTSPMVLRSRRRVGRSQEFEQEEQQQTQEELGEEEHATSRGGGLNGSSSHYTPSKTSAKHPPSYLMTLVTVYTLYLVNGVASVAASSATKLSNGSKMILPLTSYAFKTLAGTVSSSGKSSEEALANHKDNSCSTHSSTTSMKTQSFTSRETSSQQKLDVTTRWLSWFGSIVTGLFSGKQAWRRKGKRVSWQEHSMSARSKGKRHGSDGVDDGLPSPDDVREKDYDDYDVRESDYDDVDEDADDGTGRGSTTKTSSSSITTTITTVVTTVFEHLYDFCFEVEELGRRLVGAASRREERERLKQLRLTGRAGYNRDLNLLGAGTFGTFYGSDEGSDDTDGLFGVRKKDGDISYEVPRASAKEENDDSVAGWLWWLLTLLLLLSVFFAMAAWANLLGADDIITATAAKITTTASSALTTLATSAAASTSTIVSYLATAAVATFDVITNAVVFALGWSLNGLSMLCSSIVWLSWSVASWSNEALVYVFSAIGNGLSAVLSIVSSNADVEIAENDVDEEDASVQTPGVFLSALYAISSSISSLYFGAVSSAKAAGSGTMVLATAGTDAAWSGLSWIPSTVIAGVSAVTDALYFFVMWLWDGLFWGVSGLWEGLGAVLWWLWGLMVGLGSLIGGGVLSMAGSTASKTIEAANSVKLAMAPILVGSSLDASSTASSVPVPPANGVRDPPFLPSGATLEMIMAQLLQSEPLHQRLEVAVSSEVATQTTAAAAAHAVQQQQTALLLKQLQEHHQHLELQLKQLAADLARVETAGNSGRAGLSLSLDEERQQRVQQQQGLDNVHGALESISRQIEEMQRNHSLLATEVKSCCQRSLLSLADVDAHVTGLIASLIGYQAASSSDVTAPSTADLKAWMATYFVAKEEMEQQIGQLTVTLEKQIQEHHDAAVSAALAAGSAAEEASSAASLSLDAKTLEQTQQLVMAHVTEQLHEKLRVQITRDLHEDIRTHLEKKIPESIKETLHPQGEFTEALESKVKQEVEAKLKSSEVDSKMKLEVGAQLKSYLEEGGELKKGLQEDLVAYFEPQLHSHIALTVKKQVEDQVQARVDQELEAKLEDKLAQTRLDFKADMDVLDQRVTAEGEQKTNQKVVALLTASLPRLLPPTATQPAALNDTVRAIVAEVVTAHMGPLGGQTCDKKGPLPHLPTSTDANDYGDSTLAAALLQSASTLAGVGIASSSGGDLNLTVGRGGNSFNITTEGSLLTRAEVQRMVAAALKKYDADRTGLADHALETGGGAIVSTRCTEPYEVNQAQLSWLGIPLYRYSTNTPRSIIQPDRHPGQCWAFKGSQGYVVIRLVAPVQATGFTLEHIPKDVAPFGNIDSAPKNFTVWGLNTENDEGYELGSYQYREDGEALQYNAVDNPSDDYFPFIELKINSNHGNMKYTCVYRFRVHGIRMRL